MDFIPLSLPVPTWIPVLQVIGILLILSGLPLAFKKVSDSKWAGVCITTMCLGLVAMLVAFVGTGIQKDTTREALTEWESAVVAEVQDVYGIELSHDEFVALDFPATEPDEAFVAYGTIADTVVKGDMVKQKATTLIWSDGELSLGSLKGELTRVGGR